MMKATNIEWETDEDDFNEEEYELPAEIEIPEYIGDVDEITDYLSDTTGFLVRSYCLTE